MKVRGMSVYAAAMPREPGHAPPTPASGIEHRHRGLAGGGNLRAAVFGINDGLVSNASLILGVAGASSDPQIVLLTGVAGMCAGAFAMASGTSHPPAPLPIDDTRIREIKELAPPAHLLREFPVSARAAATTYGTRQAIHRVLHGADDRLLVVVGPCSIHDSDAALEYARTPRSRGASVRGRPAHRHARLFREAAHHRRLEGADQRSAPRRQLRHQRRPAPGAQAAAAISTNWACPAATEFLDTITPQYIADLIAWGAIGARTTESQVHRELASGLSCPVGFKNGTDGNIQIAVDAIKAARQPAPFPFGHQVGPLGHRLDHRQRGLPRHPARRQGAQLRRGQRRGRLRRTRARPVSRRG